jgi:flagellar protein FliO/FliZ
VQTHELSLGAMALLLVLAAIWLIQRFLRPGGLIRATPSGRLLLVQSIALDPRRRVTLLHCDGAAVLLLTGGPADVLLSSPITLVPLRLGESA